jgi:hypothetical protein
MPFGVRHQSSKKHSETSPLDAYLEEIGLTRTKFVIVWSLKEVCVYLGVFVHLHFLHPVSACSEEDDNVATYHLEAVQLLLYLLS